jgi:hypothetical protein
MATTRRVARMLGPKRQIFAPGDLTYGADDGAYNSNYKPYTAPAHSCGGAESVA